MERFMTGQTVCNDTLGMTGTSILV